MVFKRLCLGDYWKEPQAPAIFGLLSCSVSGTNYLSNFFWVAPLEMVFPKKGSLFSRVTEQLSQGNDPETWGLGFLAPIRMSKTLIG